MEGHHDDIYGPGHCYRKVGEEVSCGLVEIRDSDLEGGRTG